MYAVNCMNQIENYSDQYLDSRFYPYSYPYPVPMAMTVPKQSVASLPLVADPTCNNMYSRNWDGSAPQNTYQSRQTINSPNVHILKSNPVPPKRKNI